MRRAATISGLIHGLLIAAASLAWPRLIDRVPVEPTMSVQLVSLADQSRAPKVAKPEPKARVEEREVEKPPEPVKETPPPPPTEVRPLVPLPPAPTPLPTMKPVELPDVKPLPKLAAKPQDAPKLEKIDIRQELPEPKERVKPKPVEKKPQDSLDLSKIASTLNKMDKKPDAPAKPEAQPPRAAPTAGLEGRLSMSEKDALRGMIGRNWNVPTGAPRPEDLIVIIHFALNPDGTLASAPLIVNAGRYASDSFFRAAADAAIRAVKMTQPFKLPPEKYNDWREIELTFDPRDMIRG